MLDEVRHAADEALEPGGGLRHLSNPGVGDPLLVLTVSTGQRLGIYAMTAKSESGRVSSAFADQFLVRAAQADCDAFLWVAAATFQDDLKSLAARVERETQKSVVIVGWSVRKVGLRPGIEELANRQPVVPNQGAPSAQG